MTKTERIHDPQHITLTMRGLLGVLDLDSQREALDSLASFHELLRQQAYAGNKPRRIHAPKDV